MTSLVDKLGMSLEEIAEAERKEKQAKRQAGRSTSRGDSKAASSTTARSGRARTSSNADKPALSAKTEKPSAASKPALTTGTPVIVRNVEKDVDMESLRNIFSSVGTIKSAEMLRYNGRWHSARLVFKTKAEAEKAVEEFHERMMDGKQLSVAIQRSRDNAETSAKVEESGNKKRQRRSNA